MQNSSAGSLGFRLDQLTCALADREDSTASGLMMYSFGTCNTGVGIKSTCGMSSATLLKDSLIASATALSCKTDPFTVILDKGGGFARPDNPLILSHHFLELISCMWHRNSCGPVDSL